MNFASLRIDLNNDVGSPLSCGTDQPVQGTSWHGCFAATMDELLVDKGNYIIEIFAEFETGSAPAGLATGETDAMNSVISEIQA